MYSVSAIKQNGVETQIEEIKKKNNNNNKIEQQQQIQWE